MEKAIKDYETPTPGKQAAAKKGTLVSIATKD